ncbi:carbon storage regulator, CsrA [Pseudomonas sp. NFR16]|nr:carbon storage regulator, CsrA [Pseudomonas sp. NFR16]
MLILTRRPSESIHLGDEIVVTLLSVQGLQARLGIQAPTSVAVHRDEVYARIQRELGASGPTQIDDRVKEVAADMDPRKVFTTLNPGGFRREDLEFSGTGFADEYAQRSYVVFLSGYRAALEAEKCAS